MKYSTLGGSELSVSRVCLGTMTWGTQNNQADANEQIDHALGCGINFIDTAEMYSIPPRPESYGATESIIGHWLQANPRKREKIILASKMAGKGLPYIREGGDITGETVKTAVDGSLKRLQTDYIDLYQLHWPNRPNPHFGRHHINELDFRQCDRDQESAQMLEILQALDGCIKAGKIRHIGLSDDTPWGIHEYLRLSRECNLPKFCAIQNEYNLIHTKDWPYLVESCAMENIAYLPWSPLAGGQLSGKYLNGARPEGSRWTISQRNGLFRDTQYANSAIKEYADLAGKYGLSCAQLALIFCDQTAGVTSTIIGATTMKQLKENIAAFAITPEKSMLEKLQSLVKKYPMPF